MRLWIAMTYEPLPGIDGAARLLRCGTLARLLAAQGHDVLWWTGTFNHARKAHRFPAHTRIEVEPRLHIQLLHAPQYRHNISLARVRHNRAVASAFAQQARREVSLPDVIFVCVPTLELAVSAVDFGADHGIPVVVDAQDKWPDVFVDVFPRWLRAVARPLLTPQFRLAERVFRKTAGIVAVSETYLQWALGHANRPKRPNDRVFPLGCSRPAISVSELATRTGELRGRFGLPDGRVLLTYVGQFGANYDLKTLLAAARLLHERGRREVHVVLAGAGDNEARLRARATSLANVTFAGWLDHVSSHVLLRMSSAGLACYTATAPQSVPYKAFDYMAAGVPIISSLGGEFHELMTRQGLGLSYRAGDAESLAQCMDAVATDQTAVDTMRANVRRAFEQTYSSDVVYPCLARYLEGVASSARAQSKR